MAFIAVRYVSGFVEEFSVRFSHLLLVSFRDYVFFRPVVISSVSGK